VTTQETTVPTESPTEPTTADDQLVDGTRDPRTGEVVANHHADHPGFAGANGALMALLFAFRGGDRARTISDLAEVAPGDHVVDLGCGPGNAVREAAARGARATGVDPSSVMLRVAQVLTWRRRARIAWTEAAAESIPLADGDATVVWSVACVHHWADIDAALAEIHRILAPGGRLLAAERRTVATATGVASHGWTDEQADVFAAACRRAGFVDVERTTTATGATPTLLVRAVRPDGPGQPEV
jgi:SAM-dependent methyltransferase